MRQPSARLRLIGLLCLMLWVGLAWPARATAACNPVTGEGTAAVIFGQFASYFQAAGNRNSGTEFTNSPLGPVDRRFMGSRLLQRDCERKAADGGGGRATLILEKANGEAGVFLHRAELRLWHPRREALEAWLATGKRILASSIIGPCQNASAGTDRDWEDLNALYGRGARQMEPLCWNLIYAGYAAMLRRDLIDGSLAGRTEEEAPDHQLVARIAINVSIDAAGRVTGRGLH